MIVHNIDPLFDENSKALILGSFPSVKSREAEFFYAHKQNRFWKVLASVCEEEVPNTIEEKKTMLKENGIALWDVIHSCEIVGSADSTIKNVVPNDIQKIINNSQIDRIFTNGKKADNLYKKYIEKDINIKSVCLPSTSPANASWDLEKLTEYWKSKLKRG